MSIFLIVISLIVCFLARAYLRMKKIQSSMKNIPLNSGILLFGNIGWVMKLYSKKTVYHPAVYIFERIVGSGVLYQKNGINAFLIGSSPIVSLHSAKMVELILASNISLEKSYEYAFLQKWLGLGLLTSTGNKWRSRRKILTPSFHFRILEDFLPSFNEQSMILVEKLLTLTNTEHVDISPLIVLCTLDIVCETVMGCHIGAQKGENSDYVNAVHNLADFFNRRVVTPWLWWDFLFSFTKIGRGFQKDMDILHAFTKKVIKEKKEAILSQPHITEVVEQENEFQAKKRKALMDLLLDMHLKEGQLSENDIQEEIDTFMFEGHDTTAMGVIFALYCIGLYPEIQNKLQEEMESIFGGDEKRAITMDDVRELKYLECVVKESQRLFPSVPIIGRKLNEELHINEISIPKGVTLHCNIVALHRDPNTFPNPEIFNPDRFLPENSLKRHPYSYIPFSAGPRNCIGQKFALMEEKVIICNILRHFKVLSLDQRDKIHFKVEFTLRPAQPMRMKFFPRYRENKLV